MISHKELVTNLAKPGQEIMYTLSPSRCHLWHMMTGFVGETFELREAIRKQDNQHILEELGDAYFYIVGTCIGLFLPIPIANTAAFPAEESLVLALDEYTEAFLDAIKRHVIYNKPLEESSIVEILNNCVRIICFIGKFHGFTLKQIEDHNITKLMKRYTGGTYADSDANARKDKEAESISELASKPAEGEFAAIDNNKPGDSVEGNKPGDAIDDLEDVEDDELEDIIGDNNMPGDDVKIGGGL